MTICTETSLTAARLRMVRSSSPQLRAPDGLRAAILAEIGAESRPAFALWALLKERYQDRLVLVAPLAEAP